MMDTETPGSGAFETLADLVAWCRRAPTGTHVDAGELAQILASVAPDSPAEREEDAGQGEGPSDPMTWRERLWIVPTETRLGVAELAEALGRPKSWIYARTQKTTGKGKHKRPIPPEDQLPHRKLDGALVFTAGELRHWIRSHEDEIVGGPMDSTPNERRPRLVR